MLSQDVATGALSYQPVLATFHNPPAETLRITLGGETIVATRFHRFWRAGQGWATARDLKTGDAIRTLRGRPAISAIEPGTVRPVFNLEVAGGKTFLVGEIGALVHDKSKPPGPQLEPFDVQKPRSSSRRDRAVILERARIPEGRDRDLAHSTRAG